MLLSSSYNKPRSINISEEVKFQRQCVDPSKTPSDTLCSGKFNTLTTLSSISTKPVQRSVGLYFSRRGLKASFHGSPTLLDFIRSQQIPDWQDYLKNLIFQHPAWLTYPNIKSYELHPRLPICVDYWDGTTTGIAPHANLLHNSSSIADLLHLTDNPKASNSIQTHFTTVKGSRSLSSILRMAPTIHIRPIGVDSDDENDNTQPSLKRELTYFPSTNLDSAMSVKPNLKERILSSKSHIPSAIQSSTASVVIPDSNCLNADSAASGSTTQEDTPPPSYLSSKVSHSTLISQRVNTTSYSESQHPTTPTTSNITHSTPGRKRS